ncbi:Hsp20/alpha crystallin family protein [Candidatus Bathyarchaeota archaeon]|nr:Hsp20/alpha crystallin family protein [Candidatus Bathyarchaeota archaeon]
MRWRRSEKRPKWFRAVKRRDKVEDKIFKLENLKASKRHSQKYGSLKTFSFKAKKWREPEPLVDVFREKDKIVVVAELKGFKRENIKVQAEKQRLTLTAKAQGRRYYKSLNLPEAVIPEAARITYKNGVLEIQLKKAPEEKPLNKVAVKDAPQA